MRNNRKRGKRVDYKSFLMKNVIIDRRSVYISEDIHEKISKIVNIIGNGDISIGGYIDTVLNSHLELYKDEINELYIQKYNNLL